MLRKVTVWEECTSRLSVPQPTRRSLALCPKKQETSFCEKAYPGILAASASFTKEFARQVVIGSQLGLAFVIGCYHIQHSPGSCSDTVSVPMTDPHKEFPSGVHAGSQHCFLTIAFSLPGLPQHSNPSWATARADRRRQDDEKDSAAYPRKPSMS